MIPDHLMVHTVTVVHPADVTDAYNNTTRDYGEGATRRSIAAWLQQDQRSEPFPDGRDPLDQRWLLMSNDAEVTGIDRIEWADHPAGPVVFEIDGPPEPTYTPGGFHHLEATLRITEG